MRVEGSKKSGTSPACASAQSTQDSSKALAETIL